MGSCLRLFMGVIAGTYQRTRFHVAESKSESFFFEELVLAVEEVGRRELLVLQGRAQRLHACNLLLRAHARL